MIKTFRGLIADGAQDTIVLHTNDGSIGYRIVKFQIINKQPGTADYENVVKIYKTKQSSIDGVVDFNDNTLLAVAYGSADATGQNNPATEIVIFDKEVFNQDLYITNKVISVGSSQNYYIELEQVKLDLSESTVATLKDIRNLKKVAA